MTIPALLRPSLLLLAAVLLSGPARAAELTVSAAVSLSSAFKDLAPLFEAAHPGHKLQFNFGASGGLLQQISQGAPVDVFASADQETMDQAHSRHLIDAAQRRNVVSNALVLIVPAESPKAPQALAELAQAGYARIAIGLTASVPLGRHTKSALTAARLWTAVEPKMIAAQNARQALDYVARGEVDAGFVYATDAALLPDKVKVVLRVPTPQPILYPAAPVAGSANAELARRFVAFLATAPAQALLAKHGFGPP
ncbi:molybdate ABC transporter substrate-binding protein [Aquincola sp. S2]|uniref:Molybdate ABC transporter substrate-binding protein n=1 Tax=Pseudaquabacterium terrae TaxID=2732868 RepID=A0ABX2ETE4_9BURK|nr:molybdate ABC transporter substrate-binding protein [Aquabacterium terrae]NRF71770.1 molybdate ABC transporter substrate-binding protein [Aquabacterium terrae]